MRRGSKIPCVKDEPLFMWNVVKMIEKRRCWQEEQSKLIFRHVVSANLDWVKLSTTVLPINCHIYIILG
jgi:hypothetical protein